MRRIAACLTVLLFPLAAYAGPEVCDAAAKEIDASLRAFQAPPERVQPSQRISIRNAAAQNPAAGLDYGSAIDQEGLKAFPFPKDRVASQNQFIQRAGGEGGLVMLDAMAGTAHCHSPSVFTSGPLKALKVPEPGDPLDLCMYGRVALGAAGASPFYAQAWDDFLETDRLKIFALKDGALSQACTIAATHQIVDEVVDSFCKEPALCATYPQKLSGWAASFRTTGIIETPTLTQLTQVPVPQPGSELPLIDAKQSRIVPMPFRFDGREAWFAIKHDPHADHLRIGMAKEGPENMANWKSFTLAVLYKKGEPQASFVIEKQRGIFQALAAYYHPAADAPPADLVAAIYRSAAGIYGDYSQGASVFAEPLARQTYMSARLRATLDEMYKRANGELSNLDFDPVTNSQGSAVTNLKITTESENGQEASVLADFRDGEDEQPQHSVLRYLLVRENGVWKLDDIAAIEPNPWRITEIAKDQ